MTSKLTEKHNKRKLSMTLKRPVLTYACKTWTLSLGDLTNAIDPIPYYSPNELPHMSASGTLDLPASHVRSTRLDQTLHSFLVSSPQLANAKILMTTKPITRHNGSTPSQFPSNSHISLYFPPFAQPLFSPKFSSE